MESFEASSEGVRLRLDADEASLLRRLAGEMRVMLEGNDRSDPALERLYPQAYEDDDAAAAYQELVGDELKDHKLHVLGTVRSTLPEEGGIDRRLTEEETMAWLATLTDIRLTLGARLGIMDDLTGNEEVDPSDPKAATYVLLDWLTWLQESLVAALEASGDG